MCDRLTEIDLGLSQRVAEMVGRDVPQKESRPNHGKKAKGISQMEYIPKKPAIATRRVALIIADGYDPVAYNGVKVALNATSALPFTLTQGGILSLLLVKTRVPVRA